LIKVGLFRRRRVKEEGLLMDGPSKEAGAFTEDGRSAEATPTGSAAELSRGELILKRSPALWVHSMFTR
jgi:hypothetical protein